MNKNESFREYFQRARRDPAVRGELVRNASVSRAAFGVVAALFAAAALAASVFNGIRSGVWLPGTAIFCLFGFVGNLLVWDKFGDRIAAMKAMDDDAPAPGSDEAGNPR